MKEQNTHYVYQEPAIEFVTVAVQLCLYLEQTAEHEKTDFIEKMLCMLPLLYLKARLVPKATEELDGYSERFVTEQEYEDLREQERLKVREHLTEINQVPNETWRSILRSYYLYHMSIQEIADMLQKTPNHVSKLKGQATNMFYLVITKKW